MLNSEELQAIHLRKVQFIQKYGPHDIASDIEDLLEDVHRYARDLAAYGYLDADALMKLQALTHMCTRKHQHEPNSCSQCKDAEDVVKTIREKSF